MALGAVGIGPFRRWGNIEIPIEEEIPLPPEDDIHLLITNPLSYMWKDRTFSRGVLPLCYLGGMIGYALALPFRVLGVAKDAFILIVSAIKNILTLNFERLKRDLKNHSIILLASIGDVFIAVIGLLCPIAAYKLDEKMQSRALIHNNCATWWSFHIFPSRRRDPVIDPENAHFDGDEMQQAIQRSMRPPDEEEIRRQAEIERRRDDSIRKNLSAETESFKKAIEIFENDLCIDNEYSTEHLNVITVIALIYIMNKKSLKLCEHVRDSENKIKIQENIRDFLNRGTEILAKFIKIGISLEDIAFFQGFLSLSKDYNLTSIESVNRKASQIGEKITAAHLQKDSDDLKALCYQLTGIVNTSCASVWKILLQSN